MSEIMSKKTGINSTFFYGNQNLKRNERKNTPIIYDENQMPHKKKKSLKHTYSDQHKYATPPKQRSIARMSSTEKFYSINNEEMNRIANGFHSKLLNRPMSAPLSGQPKPKPKPKPRNNRPTTGFNSKPRETDLSLKYVQNIKVNMKLAIESTPILDNPHTPDTKSIEMTKDSKSVQKITNYFVPKQKSPIFLNNESNERNTNQMNSEAKTSPITPIALSSNVIDLDKCETPKSWRHKSCESGNDWELNTCLFNSHYNDFEENDRNETQTNIFIDWSENVLEANTPIGLKNLGNTCYMNSIVQSLFALKFFIEDLEIKFNELKTICEQTNEFSMTQKFLNLYNQYNGLRTGVQKCSFEELSSDLLDLKLCVGQKASLFLSGSQQDAAEFFNYVIDAIAEEFESCKQSEANNPIWRNFSFETSGSLVCQKCHNSTQLPNERFNALYLSIPSDKSLQTAFDDFLKDETTGHQCTRCGANQNVLSKYFAKRPKVLFLQLARYTQDGSKHTEQVLVPQVIHLTVQTECVDQIIVPSPLSTPYRSKLQNVSICNRMTTVVRKITFDNIFGDENNENLSEGFQNGSGIKTNENNLNNMLTNGSELEDSQQTIGQNAETNVNKSINRVKYQLVAVVCHHGISLSVGHYTCYVYSIENNQWFECDDNRIIKTNFDWVQKYSQMSGYCYFYVLS